MFREVQKFRQLWLWAIMSATIIIPAIAYYQQIILGRPFGNNPVSDKALYYLICFMLIFPVLMYFTNLTTEVRDGLYVMFWPFHLRFRKIEYTDCKAVTYRPIRDYGGWGIKKGLKGLAYNVSGNRGVEITRTDGRILMIGSQKPEELVSALNSLRKH